MSQVFYLLTTLAVIALTGCVATATLGSPANTTPAATSTPSPSQIVYVPVPATLQLKSNCDLLIVAAELVVVLAGAVVAACITYGLGLRDGRRESNRRNEVTYFNGRYRFSVTPEEYQALQHCTATLARESTTRH